MDSSAQLPHQAKGMADVRVLLRKCTSRPNIFLKEKHQIKVQKQAFCKDSFYLNSGSRGMASLLLLLNESTWEMNVLRVLG